MLIYSNQYRGENTVIFKNQYKDEYNSRIQVGFIDTFSPLSYCLVWGS